MAADRKKNEKRSAVSAADLIELTKEKPHVPQSAGLKEGDTGARVGQLQQYLSRFGYLHSAELQAFGVPATRAAAPAGSAGKFDANTAQALRRFQEFNSLPVTGVLDEDTVALMHRPRCGFPDVAEFVAQGNKWSKNNLTYGFQNYSPDLTQAQIQNAIQQALAPWSAVTPLSFSEVPFASPPDMVIRFVAGDHGDGSPFDGASGILAHGFYPPPNGGAIAGDLHFDEAETWTVNLPPTGIDLISVALHEFGHTLGLAHSTISTAVMAPYYTGAHRTLESDDIAGIQSIYGTKPTIKEVPKDPITDPTFKEVRKDPIWDPTVKEVRKDPIWDPTFKELSKDPITDPVTIKEVGRDPINPGETFVETTPVFPRGGFNPGAGGMNPFVIAGQSRAMDAQGQALDEAMARAEQLGAELAQAQAYVAQLEEAYAQAVAIVEVMQQGPG